MKICGSCLCQATRYEINGPLLSLGHCHCKMCQRFHGTAYARTVRSRKQTSLLLQVAKKSGSFNHQSRLGVVSAEIAVPRLSMKMTRYRITFG